MLSAAGMSCADTLSHRLSMAPGESWEPFYRWFMSSSNSSKSGENDFCTNVLFLWSNQATFCTAELLWHVQNCYLVRILFSMQGQLWIYKDLLYEHIKHLWNGSKHAYGKVWIMKNAAAYLNWFALQCWLGDLIQVQGNRLATRTGWRGNGFFILSCLGNCSIAINQPMLGKIFDIKLLFPYTLEYQCWIQS